MLSLIGPLHDATGVLGGFGYAALIALIAVRLGSGSGPGSRRRPGRGGVTRAIAATGQRSLTCYLAQSVVWAIVFTPYLLDLSDDLTVTSTALLAAATWVSTVVLADWMRRTGTAGPVRGADPAGDVRAGRGGVGACPGLTGPGKPALGRSFPRHVRNSLVNQ